MKITRTSFIQWLASLPSTARLSRRSSVNCPLATYLHQAGYPDARVGKLHWYNDRYRMYSWHGGRLLPLWASNFIERWDKTTGLTGGARSALHIIATQK